MKSIGVVEAPEDTGDSVAFEGGTPQLNQAAWEPLQNTFGFVR